jgi:hypothetical protein
VVCLKKTRTILWQLQGLDLFPLKVGVVASKVPIGGRLAHDRATQVQIANDTARAQVKVVLDHFREPSIVLAFHDGAVAVHVDGEGVRHTNGVRDLDQGAATEFRGHDGLGGPARGVGGGTIDLGRVLAGEGTTTVGAPTAVGVDDDLAAGQTGIAMGTTNDEATGRIQVVDGLVVEVLFGDDGFDDMFHEVGGNLFVGDIFGVLGGDDNGVDALGDRDAIDQLVFTGDLRLAVGTDPFAGSVLADFRQLASQLRGQHVRERHVLLGLVRGVSKHDSLITGTNVFHFDRIDGLRDIRGLFFNGDDDVAGFVVKTFGGVVVTNVLDGVANDLLVVDGSRRRDFTKDHHHARFAARFASNAGQFVTSDAGIQDRIRDLVAELVYNGLEKRIIDTQKELRERQIKPATFGFRFLFNTYPHSCFNASIPRKRKDLPG